LFFPTGQHSAHLFRFLLFPPCCLNPASGNRPASWPTPPARLRPTRGPPGPPPPSPTSCSYSTWPPRTPRVHATVGSGFARRSAPQPSRTPTAPPYLFLQQPPGGLASIPCPSSRHGHESDTDTKSRPSRTPRPRVIEGVGL